MYQGTYIEQKAENHNSQNIYVSQKKHGKEGEPYYQYRVICEIHIPKNIYKNNIETIFMKLLNLNKNFAPVFYFINQK